MSREGCTQAPKGTSSEQSNSSRTYTQTRHNSNRNNKKQSESRERERDRQTDRERVNKAAYINSADHLLHEVLGVREELPHLQILSDLVELLHVLLEKREKEVS